jgi:hypothetical protein
VQRLNRDVGRENRRIRAHLVSLSNMHACTS